MGPRGPVSSPSPNAGKEAAALGVVRQAVTQLQKIVPDLDPGSPLGKAVLKAIGDLTKVSPAADSNPQAAQQQMRQQMMEMMQGAPAAMLQRAMASQAQPQNPTPVAAA